ncbi:hypothetical protein LCGC14_1365530 [marine sediment metagenome]|uniref:Uncharacterized protein n=1 Tax=marine sediment metagenome TaxID=412755 RepID=A0A0F9KSW5_9ZZZZ
MDLNFEQLLAEHNQTFKDAEVYSNWMPPDGDYIVSLVKLTNGTSTKDGTDLIWWNLKGHIEDVQDEKLNGQEFTVGYYTSKVFGILKGAVNVLGGIEINDLAEAHTVLEASIGKVISAQVRTSRSQKNGKDYTNCYIKEVIDTTTEASTEEVPVDAVAVEADVPATIGDTPGSGIPDEAPPVAA